MARIRFIAPVVFLWFLLVEKKQKKWNDRTALIHLRPSPAPFLRTSPLIDGAVDQKNGRRPNRIDSQSLAFSTFHSLERERERDFSCLFVAGTTTVCSARFVFLLFEVRPRARTPLQTFGISASLNWNKKMQKYNEKKRPSIGRP